MTNQEKALHLFQNGYSCSQATMGSLCEQLGMSLEDGLKIASPYCGGIGGTKDICGAVNGAILLIALKCGYSDAHNDEAKKAQNQEVQKFLEYFKNENGSIHCRDIAKTDEDKKVNCPKAILSAVKYIEENIL